MSSCEFVKIQARSQGGPSFFLPETWDSRPIWKPFCFLPESPSTIFHPGRWSCSKTIPGSFAFWRHDHLFVQILLWLWKVTVESYDDDEEEYEVDEYAGSGNGHGDYASSVEAEISGDWRPRVVVQCFFFKIVFRGKIWKNKPSQGPIKETHLLTFGKFILLDNAGTFKSHGISFMSSRPSKICPK